MTAASARHLSSAYWTVSVTDALTCPGSTGVIGAASALKRAAAHAADAASVSSVLVDRLLNIEPRHTLDYLGARAYQYYSTAHEISNSLESIRSVLLVAYRTACLRHDVSNTSPSPPVAIHQRS